jgi:hypothetical protein
MIKRWVCAALAGAVIPLGVMAVAARADYPNPDPARYLFEDQIEPGMTGYGLTVMHGDKIEKFQFTVIDVMKSLEPGTNGILVKCSGLGLEESGIIAGMSGSPCFIDGKMIGAIAFGWEGSTAPIGGVQPIRQMLGIPIPKKGAGEKPVAARGGGARWGQTNAFTAALADQPGLQRLVERFGGSRRRDVVARSATTMRNLTTPLMVASSSDATMRYLREAFGGDGFTPVQSGSAGATPTVPSDRSATTAPGTTEHDSLGGVGELKANGLTAFEPGAAIAIPLLTGDLDLSAIGTITEVRGNRIWAFGHAMDADGPSNLPIGTGYIYTVLPTRTISFKMGTSYKTLGTLVMDEQTGIVGNVGGAASYSQVEMSVNSPDGLQQRTYHYQLVNHPRYTPNILLAAVIESIDSQQKLGTEFTANLTGEAEFTDGTTIPLNMSATNKTIQADPTSGAEGALAAQTVLPVAMLVDNPFLDLTLKRVKITAAVDQRDTAGSIKNVVLQKQVVAPGDTIVATAEIERFHQTNAHVTVKLKVPDDTDDGTYELAVGPSDLVLGQELHYFPQRFDPQNIKQLAEDVRHIVSYQRDRVYARLILDLNGISTNGHELRDLPVTRMMMYASEKRTDADPLFNSVSANVSAGGILKGGGQLFQITVNKHADDLFYDLETRPKASEDKLNSPGSPNVTPGLSNDAPAAPSPDGPPDN